MPSMQLIILIISLMNFFHPIDADHSNQPTNNQSNAFTGKCWVGNKRDGYKVQTCSSGQICELIRCKYDGGMRYLKHCASGAGCSNYEQLCRAHIKHQRITEWGCGTCKDRDLCNDAMDVGKDPPSFTGKCWNGSMNDCGFKEVNCPAGQLCGINTCNYDGGTRNIKGCAASHQNWCENALEKCMALVGKGAELSIGGCRTCSVDLCNVGEDEGEDPLKAEPTIKCWKGYKGFSERTCREGELCYSFGCRYDGGIRYDKGCAMDHKTVCRNSMEKCENFYPITKIFESTCDTCGTNLCNDHNHEGQDPPDNRKGSEVKFTGKCWKGNKEEGYSEVICSRGQSCYSIGCSFDGGIRYSKGCASSERDVCRLAVLDCMPWMSYLGEANFVKPICTTCKDKDLCNDEQDEGDLPDIGTGIGGGNGGLQCILDTPTGYAIKQKTQNCDPNKGQTHCLTVDFCGIKSVRGCSPEYVCNIPLIQEAKKSCEELHNKPLTCGTCNNKDLCNGDGGDGSDGSNNGSEGLGGATMLVIIVATLVPLFNKRIGNL